MKYLFVFIVAVLLSASAFGKGHGRGHGGGHGGHGGGHSAIRAQAGNAHPGYGSAHNTAAPRAVNGPGRATINTNAGRIVSPAAVIAHRNAIGYPVAGISAVHPGYYGYTYEHEGYYSGYGYGYSPLFCGPYYSMFSFGAGMIYTPHYNYVAQPGNNNDNEVGTENMYGYVVYEHDTIRGLVSLTPGAVFIENVDSGRNYDYKLRLKNKGLEFIDLYNNSDSSQLSLIRIGDNKKMLRIVHEGKLNIYDERFGFIYRPEDIDVRSLSVVNQYGVCVHIGSSSVRNTKTSLTDFVNKAYNLHLDPEQFGWKELLIYIDKLD